MEGLYRLRSYALHLLFLNANQALQISKLAQTLYLQHGFLYQGILTPTK